MTAFVARRGYPLIVISMCVLGFAYGFWLGYST